MAINRNYRDLLVTDDNDGDWTLVNGSTGTLGLSGNSGYLEFNYADSSSVRNKEILGQVTVAQGGTISITSPAVNAVSLGLNGAEPLYLLGSNNTADEESAKFLASPDGGTTYYAKTGSAWTQVAEANILTSGMTGAQLHDAGLPPGTNSSFQIKMAVSMPVGGATTSLDFIGYRLRSGSHDVGVRTRIMDFRGTGSDYFDPEQTLRFDMCPAGVSNGFGSTAWVDFDGSLLFYEPNGMIIRGSDPATSRFEATTNGHHMVDTRGIQIDRGLVMATNGTENEDNAVYRFLVDPTWGPGLSVPVNTTDFNGRSWKAWDGEAWQTVTGATEVGDFQIDGTGGMTVEQFNEADWGDLGIENDGFLLLVFGDRKAYNEDTTDDYWLDSIQGYAVTYENNTTILSPASTVAGGGIYENNSGTIVMGWRGRVMEYSDVRGAALPPSHIANEGTIDSYSAGTFPGTPPYFIARQSESVTTVDYAGNSSSSTVNRYYGPLYEADSVLEYDKHWPSTDWTNGLIVHIVSGTGAGQWGILDNRSTDDAWKFQLAHPFATAPAAGDRFVIGSLVWITLPEISAPPMMGHITLKEGRLICKLRAGSPKWWIEAYGSGDNWEVSNPAHPLRQDTVRVAELTMDNTRRSSTWEFNQTNSDGESSIGREVSLSIIGIVGHEDYIVDCLAVNAHIGPQ